MRIVEMAEVSMGGRLHAESENPGIWSIDGKCFVGVNAEGVLIESRPDQALRFQVGKLSCQRRIRAPVRLIFPLSVRSTFAQMALQKQLVGVIVALHRRLVLCTGGQSKQEEQGTTNKGSRKLGIKVRVHYGGGSHRVFAARRTPILHAGRVSDDRTS